MIELKVAYVNFCVPNIYKVIIYYCEFFNTYIRILKWIFITSFVLMLYSLTFTRRDPQVQRALHMECANMKHKSVDNLQKKILVYKYIFRPQPLRLKTHYCTIYTMYMYLFPKIKKYADLTIYKRFFYQHKDITKI